MATENTEKFLKAIRSIPDFPITGINFKDITTLLKEGDLFAESVDYLYDYFREKDVDTIVEKAVAQAEIEKSRILEAAEKSADDIKRAAESVIFNEIVAAKRDLKNGVTEQAAVMAEELIVKNLTADDQVKIIEDYLDKVGAVQ